MQSICLGLSRRERSSTLLHILDPCMLNVCRCCTKQHAVNNAILRTDFILSEWGPGTGPDPPLTISSCSDAASVPTLLRTSQPCSTSDRAAPWKLQRPPWRWLPRNSSCLPFSSPPSPLTDCPIRRRKSYDNVGFLGKNMSRHGSSKYPTIS